MKKKETPKASGNLSTERNNSKECLNSSKGKLKDESSYENEYRKLAKSDKYCEEFMYFLDDEIAAQNEG